MEKREEVGPSAASKAGKKTKNSTYCCVPQCCNYASENLHFHHFPKDKKMRETWRIALQMGKLVTDSDRVCSEHFLPTDYLPQAKPTAMRFLKKIAVPSQKLPKRKHDKVETSPLKRQKLARAMRALTRVSRTPEERCKSRKSESDPDEQAETENGDTLEAVENTGTVVEIQHNETATLKEEKGTQSEKFCLLTLLPDAAKLYTFTGLNSFQTLDNIVTCVEKVTPYSAKFILPVKIRVALCLTKLKLNMPYTALSVLFGVSEETCSHYFRHTIQVLAAVLKHLIYFPSKEETLNNIPKCFRKYVHTRIVLDCAEVPVEKPKCLRERILTYSHYKGRHTLKWLVGVSPGGLIIFVSEMFGGRASDKKIVSESKVLDKCEYGDGVMVDKGFRIDNECLVRNLRLIRPPFVRKNNPLNKAEALQCVDIAAARVHVERAIKQLRDFDILSDQVPGHLVPYINCILTVCGALVNVGPPILSMERF
ncbi:THAP domain-containing protein 11 [Frankliniella fusca]|uniref:THAP domain-containing protein 11 n=1 Tax=Frankliniella fusca TaxID=407009 RepID=A0AAE1GW85_9NEOP|nr:THAP domain-containing protein 11 [Frankliniella fusca]